MRLSLSYIPSMKIDIGHHLKYRLRVWKKIDSEFGKKLIVFIPYR